MNRQGGLDKRNIVTVNFFKLRPYAADAIQSIPAGTARK